MNVIICSLYSLNILYRRAHTESAKKWLSKLKEKENVPVLVCLTFADQLYSEIAKQICGKETQKFPPRKEVEPKLREEKEVHECVRIAHSRLWTVPRC